MLFNRSFYRVHQWNRQLMMSFCVLWLSGCLFIPQRKPAKADLCRLSTVKLELDVKEVSKNFSQLNYQRECRGECLVAVLGSAVVVSAGSAIVSGSIVVVGNTIHFLEEQGRCEESTTRKAIDTLLESTTNAGGWAVQSSKDLFEWVEKQTSPGK